MTGHEPTTILSGGPGQPTIVVRDHDGWRAQVEAEKRRQVDERIAGTIAWIREGDAERDRAPRPGLTELMADAKVNALLHQERMDAPGRVIRQLAETEALVEAMIAAEPPAPPEPTRRGRPVSKAQQVYEAAQLDHKLRQDAETMARLRG